MIPFDEIGDKVRDIVRRAEQIDECGIIEYKVKPHDSDHWTEFYKDILGLLNCTERPSEDRYLVYGIENKSKKKIGCLPGEILDDAVYQELLEKINPRPQVELKTFDASEVTEDEKGEKEFGVFYISCKNVGEVYEMGKECEDKECNGKNRKRKYPVGQSFIRHGSSTRPLTERDRIEIRAITPQPSTPMLAMPNLPQTMTKFGTSALALAAAIGEWDDACAGDRELIEEMAGIPFDQWMAPIRELAQDPSSSIRRHGSVWAITERASWIENHGTQIDERLLRSYMDYFAAVLSTADPRYDLEPAKRPLAAVLGKVRKYSPELSHGIAEFFAVIGNDSAMLTGCRDSVVTDIVAKVVWDLFYGTSWEVLASLDEATPLLSEAAPRSFLSAVERNRREGGSAVNLLGGIQDEVSRANLGGGLIRGIQVAACSNDTAVQAVRLLARLAGISRYAADCLVYVLLPWCPQIDMSVESRIGIGKALSKDGDASWHALLRLLPGVTKASVTMDKPRYLKSTLMSEQAVYADYWNVSREYAQTAIDGVASSADRALELLDHIDAFSCLGMLRNMLAVVNGVDMDADTRYLCWEKTRDYLVLCKRRSSSACVLSEDDRKDLVDKEVSLRPGDPLYLARYYFSSSDRKLMESTPYEEERVRISKLRIGAIGDAYEKHGFSAITSVLEHCDNPTQLGWACASCPSADRMLGDALGCLSGKDRRMSRMLSGYLQEFYRSKGIEWAEEVAGGLDDLEAAQFYGLLPCIEEVWSRAELRLGGEARPYWARTTADFRPESSTSVALEHMVGSLNREGRYPDSLRAICFHIERGMEVSGELVLDTIASWTPTEETYECYLLPQIFVWLESVSPGDELFQQEFRCYSCLKGDGEDKPAYVHRRMAEDPSCFVAVVDCLDAKGPSQEVRVRAYEVLSDWKVQPGTRADGRIDPGDFAEWVSAAGKALEGRKTLGLADELVGRCLFYSAKDDDGFFVNRTVAGYLDLEEHDRARQGYDCEATNSLGAWVVDGTGSEMDAMTKQYNQKAEQAEGQGYINLAITLRNIANGFRSEAMRERD